MVKKILFPLAVVLLVLFCLVPFVQMVSVSFKYSWDWGNPSLIPTVINKEAYGELLNPARDVREPSPIMHHLLEEAGISDNGKSRILERYQGGSDIFPFSRFFTNSFLFASLSALAATILASMGAYALGRIRFKGKGTVYQITILVYLIGGIVLVVPLYKLSTALGLLRTDLTTAGVLYLIYLMQTLPVALYLLGNYFRAIPTTLDEAGLMDGLTRSGVLVRLIIPLSRNALTTVFIYCFTIVWNDYLFASVFLKSYPHMHTLSMGLRMLFYSKNAIWDRIMAASVLTALPVIFLFMAIQNNLERGFSEGLKE